MTDRTNNAVLEDLVAEMQAARHADEPTRLALMHRLYEAMRIETGRPVDPDLPTRSPGEIAQAIHDMTMQSIRRRFYV
jgi:hypothetical protein